MTREIVAAVCGITGIALAMICVYAMGGWIYLGALVSIILILTAGSLGFRPERPDKPV